MQLAHDRSLDIPVTITWPCIWVNNDPVTSKARQLEAGTPKLQEPHRPRNDDKPDIQKNDIRLTDYGTSSRYAIAKLRKDRPDIHARVLNGELTPNAGMVEAGFRKKAVRHKRNIAQQGTRTDLLPNIGRKLEQGETAEAIYLRMVNKAVQVFYYSCHEY